ncbi:MAG TPA: hypothetical protein VF773_22650 [Verrucomicrobiae bacterium]
MSEKRLFSKRFWIAASVLASIPAVYVLSIGPVALIWIKFDLEKHPVTEDLAAFYSPLENYALGNDELPAKLLKRYVELWIGPD